MAIFELSSADGATPVAYITSARNLIRSRKAVKLKMNALVR